MKTCSKCKREKLVGWFSKKSVSPDGLQSECKDCRREYAKDWYVKNCASVKARSIRNNAQYRIRNRAWVREYLLAHPCVDCGEPDPVVLEFDHQRDKVREVCRMMEAPLHTLKAEIEKCEVRCANCHRRKTAKDFGWHDRKAA